MAISSLAIGSGLRTWCRTPARKPCASGASSTKPKYRGRGHLRSAIRRPEPRYRAPHDLRAGSAPRSGCKQTVCRGFVVAGSVTGWLGTGVSLALAARSVCRRDAERPSNSTGVDFRTRPIVVGNTSHDLTTSEEHTVKPRFNGKLDVSPPVIDLAPQGFPPMAVGSIIFATASSALLIFKYDQHVIKPVRLAGQRFEG